METKLKTVKINERLEVALIQNKILQEQIPRKNLH